MMAAPFLPTLGVTSYALCHPTHKPLIFLLIPYLLAKLVEVGSVCLLPLHIRFVHSAALDVLLDIVTRKHTLV